MDADDGRTPEHGYTLSSPCEPSGSGELINLFHNYIKEELMDSEGFGDGWHDCAVTLSGISCSPKCHIQKLFYRKYVDSWLEIQSCHQTHTS